MSACAWPGWTSAARHGARRRAAPRGRGRRVIAVEQLFGFVGLIVAVPLIATVRVLVAELWILPMEERTLPLATPGAVAARPQPLVCADPDR